MLIFSVSFQFFRMHPRREQLLGHGRELPYGHITMLSDDVLVGIFHFSRMIESHFDDTPLTFPAQSLRYGNGTDWCTRANFSALVEFP
jgi:hypothetical protein